MIRSLTAALAAIVLAAPTLFAGAPVPAGITLDLPALPAGKTLRLDFDTIVQPLGGDTSDISNQARIIADGGINEVTDDPGTAAPDDPTLTVVFENAAPTTGTVTAGNVGAPEEGDTSYSFSVVYMDDGTVTNVDVSTIDSNDVTVTGPGGPLTVTNAVPAPLADGTPITTTYTVTPPGGTWDAADNGIYTIGLAGMQVGDTGSAPALFAAANASLATFDVNIPDPSYTIVALSADKPEGDAGTTPFTFTVNRGGDTGVAGSVAYTVSGADAADFSSSLTGTIPFPMGSSSEILTVDVVGDTDVEGDEGFTVTLSNPMPAPLMMIGTPASAAGTIQNDDATVTVAVAPPSIMEDDAGVLTYTFTRAGAMSDPLTVNFNTGGDAASGTDYTASASGTVTFSPGAPTSTVTIDPTADIEFELDETVVLTLTAGAGYSVDTPSVASGTIGNDDVLTVDIAATDPDADENVPDSGNFRISRNSSMGPLEVQIALDPASTATPAVDFGLGGAMLAGGAGTVTIPDGDTFIDIELIPNDDIPAEAAEDAILEITADAAYTIGASGSDTVTIAANDFVVTNADDFMPGPGATGQEGTLRQALRNADNIAGPDTVTFSAGAGGTLDFGDGTPRTISLAGSQLRISSVAAVSGPGADLLTISGNSNGDATANPGESRVLSVDDMNMGPPLAVTVSGMTIADGYSSGGGPPGTGGAGILNRENLTLSAVRVTGCRTPGNGGGIQSPGPLTIVDSCIDGNQSDAGDGGGIAMRDGTITNSTISGNRAAGSGGGISGNGPPVILDHVTITDNHADSDMSGDPGHTGGGINASPISLTNSIVAGNFRDGAGPSDIDGFVDSIISIYNLIGVDTGVIAIPALGPSNQIGTAGSPIDPLLGPLSDNGGPTLTHAILPASPALDTGDPAFNPAAFMPPLNFDQRGPGFVRVFNGTVDIGAFELPNVPPTVAADNAMVMVDEGSEATNTGTFSDTAGDTVIITADIGTVMQTGTDSGTWSWSYTPDDGPLMPTVTITATDALMEQTTTTFDLDVKNVNPTVLLDPIAPIDENGVATLTGTITDPGVLDTFTLDINWGDPLSPDNTEQFMFAASATGTQGFTLTHQYLDDNPTATAQDSYAVSASIEDNDMGTGMGGTSVIVRDVAPTVVLDPVIDINEDGTVSLSGTITDPGTLDSFSLDIDWGDPLSPGNTEQVMLPPSPSGSQGFMLTHQYLDDNPSGTARDDYTVQVTVTDDDTLSGGDSETFQISNVRPQLTLDPVMSIDENGVATLSGKITDPGTLDTFSMFVDWGDPLSPNNYEMPTFGASLTGTQPFTLTHQYPDDNPSGTPQDSKTILVLLLDDEGASTVKFTPVQINNVAPEITALNATPSPGGVTVDVAFTDPGTPDTHTAQILWGDGSSTPLTLPVGDRSFQASHSYAMEPPPGGYSITVTVTDDDTGSDTDSTGPPAPPAGPSEIDEVERLANGDFRFGFSAMPGEEFQIYYSHDLVTWFPVVGTVTATGPRVQWTDEGPPATMSDPSSVPKRFYRYVKLGGMMPPP